MFPQWLRYLGIAMLTTAVSCVRGFGSSPAEDNLLRLVPADAAIVAGIQDPHHGDQSGRLLIVTHNNNVDLKDWIGLVGVDDRQEVDKLIEVAMSSSRGELSEHLLLAEGSFNGGRILEAAETGGGIRTEYKGVRIVNLKPFAREPKGMRDTRWLTILNNNIAIFGTPITVMRALDRYVSSPAADGRLMQWVEELKPDVNCWSILTVPGAELTQHLRAGVVDDASAAVLREVSSITVGLHYGGKERVDFALRTKDGRSAAALATAMGKRPLLVPVAETTGTHLDSVSVEGNEVRGSLRVKDNEFDGWLAAMYARPSGSGPGGEEVARSGGAR